MPPAEVQVLLWQQFFSDPTQWSDNRGSKPTPRHPDFRHKLTNIPLWLNNWHKPAWVDSQLALLDAGLTGPLDSKDTSAQGRGTSAGNEGRLELEMCKNLCEVGQVNDALAALKVLVQKGSYVPNNLIYCVLRRCIASKNLVVGRRIHALIVESGYEGDAFLATHLISLYSSHGRLEEAMRVFNKVYSPDAHLWASIIFACSRHGEAAQAIRLYQQMLDSNLKPDNRIYVAVLKACATLGDIATGKEVHVHILAGTGEPDIFVQTGLLDMYAKCRSLDNARKVFDGLSEKTVVTWNAMLGGYAQQGMGEEALTLYSNMQQEGTPPPDSVTFLSLLQACGSIGSEALDQGRQLHAQIEELGLHNDVVLGGSLINMYAKCSSIEDARNVFDRLPEKSVLTWTAMIAGYTQRGMGQEALALYSSMLQDGMSPPNSVTFLCLLQACASVGVEAFQMGKQLHAQIEERDMQDDVILGGSLVHMYAKCGSLQDARVVFDKLPRRNVVTWNAMLAGYVDQGKGQEALALYTIMKREGITPPDYVTYVSLLQACGIVSALPMGKQLHAQIEEQDLQRDPVVGAALVNMYAKCGSIIESQQVFDALSERTVEAWGALIGGYTRHGDSEAVIGLLDRMRLEGVQPDGITLLSVLTVCSHVGLVDKGREYFAAMTADYGVRPTVEHYTCMMDLLGRAGHLDEALQLAKAMPFPANSAVWLTLLGACQKWNNVEIGRQAFGFAVQLNAKDASPYVMMCNIYAGAGMKEEAQQVQATRLKVGARKAPGQSWVSDSDVSLHTFLVGDKK